MEQIVGSLLFFPYASVFYYLLVQQYSLLVVTQYGQDLPSQVQQRDLFHQNLTASLSKEKTMDMVIITIFLLIINNFISQRNTYNTSSKRLKSSRSSHPEMFPGKGVRKICSKFTGEHPCRCAISIKLFCCFIEIALRHGCSPVNLLHIFRTPFLKNTFERLLLEQQF